MSQNHTNVETEEQVNSKVDEKENSQQNVDETAEDQQASAETVDEQTKTEQTEGASDDQASSKSQENDEQHALKAQIDELQNRLLRTQADFDNFRRRTRSEKEEAAKYASQNVIEQLLPVVDNFERAVSASKENQDVEALLKGLDMIYRQLGQVLEGEGVKPIEAVGQPFNPEYHHAVMQVESDEHEAGTVIEELQRGYMLKDKVIRPAMVKVNA